MKTEQEVKDRIDNYEMLIKKFIIKREAAEKINDWATIEYCRKQINERCLKINVLIMVLN